MPVCQWRPDSGSREWTIVNTRIRRQRPSNLFLILVVRLSLSAYFHGNGTVSHINIKTGRNAGSISIESEWSMWKSEDKWSFLSYGSIFVLDRRQTCAAMFLDCLNWNFTFSSRIVTSMNPVCEFQFSSWTVSTADCFVVRARFVINKAKKDQKDKEK